MEIDFVIKNDPIFCRDLSIFLHQFNPNINWEYEIDNWKLKNKNQKQIIESIKSLIWIDKDIEYFQDVSIDKYLQITEILDEFMQKQMNNIPNTDTLFILNYSPEFLSTKAEIEINEYREILISLLESKMIKYKFINEKSDNILGSVNEINFKTLQKLQSIFEVKSATNRSQIFDAYINDESWIFDLGFLFASKNVLDYLLNHKKIIHFNFLGIENYDYIEYFRLIYLNLN